MRALFVENLETKDSLLNLEQTHVHHLKNVLRLKKDQEVLLLDGKGLKAKAQIIELEKRSGKVLISEIVKTDRLPETHLILGVTKKENVEEIVKSTQMCGVSKLSLVQVENSPYLFKMSERIQTIKEQALQQSNAPYLLEINHYSSLKEAFKNLETDQSFLCDWGFRKVEEPLKLSQKRVSLFIGPEGGFSEEEKELILKETQAIGLTFSTPILRATHAVTFGLGFIEAHRHLP